MKSIGRRCYCSAIVLWLTGGFLQSPLTPWTYYLLPYLASDAADEYQQNKLSRPCRRLLLSENEMRSMCLLCRETTNNVSCYFFILFLWIWINIASTSDWFETEPNWKTRDFTWVADLNCPLSFPAAASGGHQSEPEMSCCSNKSSIFTGFLPKSNRFIQSFLVANFTNLHRKWSPSFFYCIRKTVQVKKLKNRVRVVKAVEQQP